MLTPLKDNRREKKPTDCNHLISLVMLPADVTARIQPYVLQNTERN